MTGHPTFGPATAVVVCNGAADDATTAAFADLLCTDRELLAAEFDAIITANFPDPAEGGLQPRVPVLAVAIATDRDPPHRAAGAGSRRSGRGVAGTPHPQPRERGPPPPRHARPGRTPRPIRRPNRQPDPTASE